MTDQTPDIATIGIKVDATGVDATFAKIDAGAAKMATSVEQSAEKTGKAVGTIGDGGQASAQKVEQSSKSIVESVQRTTAALAAQGKGNADTFRPYLSGLDDAKRKTDAVANSLSGVGISAKQTAAALRGVPAQFTDIVTSLQGGQAPLTVLLQQGGQLKDMFGGSGNAAKALGGYVLGLVNPFTVAAAAAGGLGLAYYKGTQESDAYTKALTLSGNAAGTTAGQLADMAKRIGGVAGTQGNAADALATFAGDAKVGAANLEAFTTAAIRFERITGQAVSKTADKFADLAKDPLAASLKLNEGMNYLTVSTYKQIKALDDQGRATEAADLAQKTFADTLANRSGDMEQRLGSIERAWLGIKDAIKGAADQALNIGRADTAEDQLRRVRNMIATKSGSTSTGRAAEIVSAELAGLQEQERILTGRIAAEARLATEKARSADQAKALIDYEKEGLKYQDGRRKMEAEIVRQRNLGIAAGLGKSEIDDREKAIRDEFNKSADKAAASRATSVQSLTGAIRGQIEAEKQSLALLQQYGLAADSMTSAEKNVFKIRGQLLTVTDAKTRAELQAQLVETQRLAGAEKATQAERGRLEVEKALAQFRLEGFKAIESQYAKGASAAEQSAKAVQDRVTALRDEEEAIQRAQLLNISLAAALEQVRVARLEAEPKDARGTANQQQVEALEKELALRRELVGLSDRKSSRDTANEDLKKFMKPDFSTDFSAGFDKSSQSAGVFVNTLSKLIDAQDRYNKVRSDSKASGADLEKARVGYQRQQLNNYAALAGSAKGFFREQSDGYRALQATETAFRAYEVASTVFSLAQTGVRTAAKATEALVAQLTLPFPANVPAFAATAAVLAGLGLAVGGGFGGGGSSEAPVPLNTGTGTVFGDPEAQSKSIANSIDLLKDVDTLTMRYSAQMLASLRNIESSLAGVTGQILRNGGNLTGASFTGSSSSQADKLLAFHDSQYFSVGKSLGLDLDIGTPLVAAAIKGLLGSTKTSLADAGLQFGSGNLQGVLANGLAAQAYQTVETSKKSLFGLVKSSSTNTSFQGLDPSLTNQFTNLVKDTYDSIISATKALGLTTDVTAAKLAGFTVDLGRISLKGLSGEQIQERLTAVFGAFADNLATAAASQFGDFQKVGEGYYETLVRVASGYEEANTLLGRLGATSLSLNEINRKQGDVAAELVRQSLQAKEGLTGVAEVLGVIDDTAQAIADTYKTLTGARTDLRLLGLDGSALGLSLIQGAGGIEALTDSLKAFEDGFVSDSDKIASQAERMSIQFKLLGLTLPQSGDAFVSLVKGIDTSTEAGKTLLGSLLGLSGGFSDLLGAIKDVGSGIADEIERIKGLSNSGAAKSSAQLQAEFAINTAQARAGDQKAIDLLPSISQALLKAAEATAGSSVDLAIIQARTLASLQSTLDAISDPTKRLGTIPGFASGGSFPGGWRVVGENGPELEATGPARIYDASQTARIMRDSAGGAELVAEMRAVRAEIAAHRNDQRAQAASIAASTGKTAQILEGVTQDGTAVTTVVAS